MKTFLILMSLLISFCVPSYAGALPTGTLCTLAMITEGGAYGQTPLKNLSAMKVDGFTCAVCDIFTTPATIEPWLTTADTLGINIAPHIDASYLWRVEGENDSTISNTVITAIESYVTVASGHSSALHNSKGQLVVFWYNINQLPIDDEQFIQKSLQDEPICLMVSHIATEPYLQTGWGGHWDFFPGSTADITSLMPQYTRAGAKRHQAYDGGVRYTKQWNQAIAAKASAIQEVSWNDAGDGSEIAGNATLEKITQTESAIWKEALK